MGLELLHLREEEDCNGVRELKPIDRNLRYDFDYQNAVYLDNIVVQKVGPPRHPLLPLLNNEVDAGSLCMAADIFFM